MNKTRLEKIASNASIYARNLTEIAKRANKTAKEAVFYAEQTNQEADIAVKMAREALNNYHQCCKNSVPTIDDEKSFP